MNTVSKPVKFTTPKLYKGKKPTAIPKGSNLEKEWAKNTWYVNYSFNGRQYRIKEDLNRIKDPKEKARKAEIILKSVINDLEKGYNPEAPAEYLEKLLQSQITIDHAVEKYLEDLQGYARPKTVQSYESKLRYLVEAFHEKPIKSIEAEHIQEYISKKIRNNEAAKVFMNGRYINLKRITAWTPNTVRSAKGIFRAFFQWCIQKKYYPTKNPISLVESKRIRSEVEPSRRNIPFSEQDNSTIMRYLDDNDRLTAFFCRFIYYTCLRPGELSQLKIKDIDFVNRRIVIPLSISKNTKRTTTEVIRIESNLYDELTILGLQNSDPNYFLFSSKENIAGESRIGNNVIYKRFSKALKKLGLDKQGYNLYSFKHFSNIQRYNSGWKLTEIMKANRHSSIAMTEEYLKHISLHTDLSEKSVPKI